MTKPGSLRPTATASPSAPGVGGLAELGARVHVDVTIPRTTTRGRMRLVSRSEAAAIHAETRAHFAESGAPITAAMLTEPNVVSEHLAERAVRHLAVAVRDPADESKPLAPLSQWREECDDDQIGVLWMAYNDHAAAIDPVGQGVELSEEDAIAMREASKKKDVDLLMSFGSRKLAIFSTTLVDPPAT